MLQSMVGPASSDDPVMLEFYPSNYLISNNQLFCKFQLRTSNLVEKGGLSELVKSGMISSKFSSENKLERLDMFFDAMTFMQQIKRCSNRDDLMVQWPIDITQFS